MKIGILTLPYKCNYGGILQCLALQNTLLKAGHEVEVIRYIPNEHSGIFRRIITIISSFSSFRDIYGFTQDQFKSFYAKLTKKKQNPSPQLLDNCRRFIAKHLNYTQTVNEKEIAYLASRYDAILVGSDQVWTGLGQKHLIYLFEWFPLYEGLKISYAACSANSNIPRINASLIKNKLKAFDALSVRDENTYRLVEKNTGIRPQIVADPTLLYDFQDLHCSPLRKGHYIFCYILGGEIQGGHSRVIQEIRQVYGEMPVIAIALPDCSLEAEYFANQVITDASPEVWFNLLIHSDFVYTDSFHGCIFSMKYQKKFLAYYSYTQRTSRLVDLKRRYGLNNVIVRSTEEMDRHQSIRNNADYSVINPLVEKYRAESFHFLHSSLQHKK